MKTTLTKILFTSMVFSAAVPSVLFSAEEECAKPVISQEKQAGLFKRTKLLNAIDCNKINIVQRLIKQKIDVNFGEDIKPLMMAAFRGHLRIVKILMKHKANVNSRSFNGATPLMFVVPQGNLIIARVLVEAKADPGIEDNDGQTVLQMAASQIADPMKKLAMIKLLGGADEAADMRGDGVSTNLGGCDLDDDTKLLSSTGRDFALEDGADFNAELILAVEHVCEETVKRLLNNKANIHCRVNNYTTLLQFAASQGDASIIQLFLEHMTDRKTRV